MTDAKHIKPEGYDVDGIASRGEAIACHLIDQNRCFGLASATRKSASEDGQIFGLDEVALDCGRIGPVVVDGRVGLRVWVRHGLSSWSDTTVWVEYGDSDPAGVYARCALAIDGPMRALRTSQGSYYCTITEITRLTGLTDGDFDAAGREVNSSNAGDGFKRLSTYRVPRARASHSFQSAPEQLPAP